MSHVEGAVLPVRAGHSRESLDDFYRDVYPRLVAVIELTYGSRADAEEIAQEAFVRLLPRWADISGYEDPERWLRAVAWNIAASRWRSLKVAARIALRLRIDGDDVPEPSVDGVLVASILARLSAAHRQVLVLHHALGLSTAEIADELGIPQNTVKTRLSRARTKARLEGERDDAG